MSREYPMEKMNVNQINMNLPVAVNVLRELQLFQVRIVSFALITLASTCRSHLLHNTSFLGTDVTFEYEMNMNYHDVDVFGSNWKDVLKGVFSAVVYEPKLTVYDPVPIALPPTNS